MQLSVSLASLVFDLGKSATSDINDYCAIIIPFLPFIAIPTCRKVFQMLVLQLCAMHVAF